MVLEEIVRQAVYTYPEVFIASELTGERAACMFAVLLPWWRGRIQTFGCCENAGNPNRCRRGLKSGASWSW